MYNDPYSMNYYPYNYNYYNQKMPKPSLFRGLKKYNWNNFLNGTGKTLNVINQAIPIIYQVRPILNNAITMFRVMNAVRGSDSDTNSKVSSSNVEKNNISNKTSSNNLKQATNDSYDDNSNLTFFI